MREKSQSTVNGNAKHRTELASRCTTQTAISREIIITDNSYCIIADASCHRARRGKFKIQFTFQNIASLILPPSSSCHCYIIPLEFFKSAPEIENCAIIATPVEVANVCSAS
jgi:hypothetical protein